LTGGKGMAGVAAALGDSGPARGRAPVRAGGTGTLGTRVGGDSRLIAAGYMAICLTGKAATNSSMTDDGWVTTGSAAGFPSGRAGSPIGGRPGGTAADGSSRAFTLAAALPGRRRRLSSYSNKAILSRCRSRHDPAGRTTRIAEHVHGGRPARPCPGWKVRQDHAGVVDAALGSAGAAVRSQAKNA
jgi:hypothetical protein